MTEMKDGESDVTSRTLSTRIQSVISNLSGIVNVLKFQTARDDVVDMRETKDRESDVYLELSLPENNLLFQIYQV